MTKEIITTGTAGSAAAEDPWIFGASEECQAFYDAVRRDEPNITKVMTRIADETGTTLFGLENSVKTGTGVLDKLERKMSLAEEIGKPATDVEAIRSMTDLIRYTFVCENDETEYFAEDVKTKLEARGFAAYETDNKWTNPNPETGYVGIHVGIVSKDGDVVEVQIHTPKSLEAKRECKPLYDEIRNVKESEERRRILSEIRKRFESLERPKGIESVKSSRVDFREMVDGMKFQKKILIPKQEEVEIDVRMDDLISERDIYEEINKAIR